MYCMMLLDVARFFGRFINVFFLITIKVLFLSRTPFVKQNENIINLEADNFFVTFPFVLVSERMF